MALDLLLVVLLVAQFGQLIEQELAGQLLVLVLALVVLHWGLLHVLVIWDLEVDLDLGRVCLVLGHALVLLRLVLAPLVLLHASVLLLGWLLVVLVRHVEFLHELHLVSVHVVLLLVHVALILEHLGLVVLLVGLLACRLNLVLHVGLMVRVFHRGLLELLWLGLHRHHV